MFEIYDVASGAAILDGFRDQRSAQDLAEVLDPEVERLGVRPESFPQKDRMT